MTISNEQFDSLRPGDRVLVEATITSGAQGSDHRATGSWGVIWLAAHDIHSILPRQVRVGDRVKTGTSIGTALVVHVDGGAAMLRDDFGHFIGKVSDLEVIQASKEK